MRRIPQVHNKKQCGIPGIRRKKKLEPLKKELKDRGFKMGGIGPHITNVVHTQGWVHCHSACTDASGLVKAMMDELS